MRVLVNGADDDTERHSAATLFEDIRFPEGRFE
jgi:hypothetical protein